MSFGIFGNGSNMEQRLIRSYERLEEVIKAIRITVPNIRIVMTSGTYDLAHVGHGRYLEAAKKLGDVLVVGVDSDAKTCKRKGPNRPVVPELERVEMLAHMRHVDLLFVKNLDDGHLKMLKTVMPDVLVVTEREKRSAEDMAEIQQYAKEIVALESQATASTTNRIRMLMLSFAREVREKLAEASHKLSEVDDFIKKTTGG